MSRGITIRLDNTIERFTIGDQVLDDRERTGAPRFDLNMVSILEATHMQLAGGNLFFRTVSDAINDL